MNYLSEGAAWRYVAEWVHRNGYGGLCGGIIVTRGREEISRDTARAMFRKIKAEGRRVYGPGYRMDEDYIWKPYTTNKRSARYRWAIAQAEKLEEWP